MVVCQLTMNFKLHNSEVGRKLCKLDDEKGDHLSTVVHFKKTSCS